jgi:hypothetical protein
MYDWATLGEVVRHHHKNKKNKKKENLEVSVVRRLDLPKSRFSLCGQGRQAGVDSTEERLAGGPAPDWGSGTCVEILAVSHQGARCGTAA